MADGTSKQSSTCLSFNAHIDEPFEQVLEKVTIALKKEGFGILTHIDVKATLHEKLGKEFRRYAILGACNPPIAYRALKQSAEVGLMLPCNVTVEEDEKGGSIVRIIDPSAILMVGALADDPVMKEVADEARERLKRVAESL